MDSELIIAAAEASSPAALVTVLETKGSTPRHAGAKMLVRSGLPTLGTVGGGSLENAALAEAQACMEGRRSTLIDVEMRGEAALGSEMICGGSSRMLVEFIADTEPYKAAGDLLRSGKRAVFVKRIVPGAGGSVDASVFAFGEDAFGEDAFGEGEPSASADPKAVLKALATGRFAAHEEGRVIYDPVFPAEKLVILGGGHVGRALARLAIALDFAVTVVDDRPEMADPARFPSGVRVMLSGYARAVAELAFDGSTYAVIMTRGHLFDLEAARAVLGREYRYAGMIGSIRKTRMILDQLRSEGLDRAKIDALCAPIGLDIGAETPEEIAVCIVGELVAVRRNAKSLSGMAAARAARLSPGG